MPEKEIDTSKKVTIKQVNTYSGKKYAISGDIDWNKLQWTFNNL
uniref:Uncharacterized protein n=1 Tax=viral metagenome TaxID=1070528 RepID=A0A6C0J943_9ZZZZ